MANKTRQRRKGGAQKRTRNNNIHNQQKRSKTEVNTELHSVYQPLIDVIGTENILDSLASMLGREGLLTYGTDTNSNGNISSRIRKANSSIPADFSGVAFDGAHWKGYEPTKPDGTRVVYDSYVYGLQLKGSNNFCQSFATFLWARRGQLSFNGPPGSEININFVPGRFTDNIKQMATLWLAWIETMMSQADSKRWLTQAIPRPYNIQQIKATMQLFSLNDQEASTFAKSS